jgi:hypothetical protein
MTDLDYLANRALCLRVLSTHAARRGNTWSQL